MPVCAYMRLRAPSPCMCLWRFAEGLGCPGTVVTGSGDTPNLRPLEKQQLLLKFWDTSPHTYFFIPEFSVPGGLVPCVWAEPASGIQKVEFLHLRKDWKQSEWQQEGPRQAPAQDGMTPLTTSFNLLPLQFRQLSTAAQVVNLSVH